MALDVKVSVRKSAIHGQGVFAEQWIARGRKIGRFEGRPTDRDGMYVLWILDEDDEFRGVEGTTELRYINHADRPNAEFCDDEVFALRSIWPGEEITCHYGEAWEDDPAWDDVAADDEALESDRLQSWKADEGASA